MLFVFRSCRPWKTPLVLKHASKRPLFDKEKAMNGPSVKPMSPWAEAFCKSANDAKYGHSLLQSPVCAYMFFIPNFPTYWLRLQNQGACTLPCSTVGIVGHYWKIIRIPYNTIMYYTSDWFIPHPSIKGALCPQSKRHNYVKIHFRRLSTISTGPSAVPTMICTSSGMGQNSKQQQGASPFPSKWLGSPLQVAVRHKCTEVPQQDTAASGAIQWLG